MYLLRNTETLSRNHCCRACVCGVGAVVTQHAKHMRRMILSVACLAAPNFYILSRKRRDFRKKVTERKICFNFISIFFCETFLILRGIQRYIVINVKTSSC